MLGYMTKAKAKDLGFTHHGSYYGIPLWLGDPEGDFMVAVKWAPLDLLFDVFTGIEQFLFPAAFGADAEPCFMFTVGEAI